MPIEKKTGKLNKQEKEFIKQHCFTHDDIWIGEELNRHPHLIKKYRLELDLNKNVEQYKNEAIPDVKYKLQARPYWPKFKKQFSIEELDLVIYHWSSIITQFNEDVTTTEEQQILDLIRMEILINRNLEEKAESLKQIERLQKSLDREYGLPDNLRNNEFCLTLSQELSMLKAAQRASTEEHMKLDKAKQHLAKELKGTRDQRYKIVEDSKSQFKDLLAAIHDEKSRRKFSQELAISKHAAEKELVRLSDFHAYVDDEVDQPILNSETIKDG